MYLIFFKGDSEMNLKILTISLLIIGANDVMAAEKICPQFDSAAVSTKFREGLLNTGEYAGWQYDIERDDNMAKEGVKTLATTELPKPVLGIGGKMSFNAAKSIRDNNASTGEVIQKCAYQYAISAKDAASASKETNKYGCPKNRVCFEVSKIMEPSRPTTNAPDKPMAGAPARPAKGPRME